MTNQYSNIIFGSANLPTIRYITAALDPLTSLEVSCVAEDEDCYLEANCVPSQPGLVSGCTLDYTRSASGNVTKLNDKNRITAMSCENQNISYNGTAYNSMLRSLGCPRSGVTKCHLMRGKQIIVTLRNYS